MWVTLCRFLASSGVFASWAWVKFGWSVTLCSYGFLFSVPARARENRETHEPRSRPTTIPRYREEEPVKSRSLKTAQDGARFFAFRIRDNFLGPRNPGKPRKTGREVVISRENSPTHLGEEPENYNAGPVKSNALFGGFAYARSTPQYATPAAVIICHT